MGVRDLDFFFNPSAITVPAGDVTFVLNNPKSLEGSHDMNIGPDAPECTVDACTFGPATAESATVPTNSEPIEFTVKALAAGTYSYWCSIKNHAALGMIGKLTVTP
jgi:plastocyanin